MGAGRPPDSIAKRKRAVKALLDLVDWPQRLHIASFIHDMEVHDQLEFMKQYKPMTQEQVKAASRKIIENLIDETKIQED